MINQPELKYKESSFYVSHVKTTKLFRAKQAIFAALYLICKNDVINFLVYDFLLIIETIQMSSHEFLHRMNEMDESSLSTYLTSSLHVITRFNFNEEVPLWLMIILTAIFHLHSIFLIFLLIFSGPYLKELESKFPVNYVAKFSSIVLTLNRTLICFPMLVTCFKFLDFSYYGSESKATAVVLMIISIINIISLFSIEIIRLLLHTDKSPRSKLAWAKSIPLVDWLKFMIKIVGAILLVSHSGSGEELISVMFGVMNFVIIYYIYKRPPYLNMSVGMLESGCSIFRIVLSSLLVSYNTTSTGGEYTAIVGVTGGILVFNMLRKWKTIRIASNFSILQIREFAELEELFYLLLKWIKNRKFEKMNSQLLMYIKNHSKCCTKKRCICRKINAVARQDNHIQNCQSRDSIIVLTDSQQNQTPENTKQLLFESLKKKFSNSVETKRLQTRDQTKNKTIDDVEAERLEKMDLSRNEIELLNLLKEELKTWLANYPKNAEIYLFIAYIDGIYLNLKYKAVFNLSSAQAANPDILQEFMIYSFTRSLEADIRAEEGRTMSSSVFSSISTLVRYQQKYLQFHSLIMETTVNYHKIWSKFLKPNPNYNELLDLGEQITKQLQEMTKIIKIMNYLNSHNLKGLILYALFLRKVEEDFESAHELFLEIRRARDTIHISKKFWHEKELKYGANSTCAVVSISGNRETLGEITSMNNELFVILGYTKKKILGKNISVIMPPIIGQFHSELLIRYFQKINENSDFINQERLVLAQHTKGFLIPLKIFVQIIPNLENGLQFMAFINPAIYLDQYRDGDHNVHRDNTVVLLTDGKTKIEGINKTLLQMFGVNMENINLNQYISQQDKPSLEHIFPQLFTNENKKQLQSEGVDLEIDFRALFRTFNRYLLEFENPMMEDDNEMTISESMKEKVNVKLKKFQFEKGMEYEIVTFYMFNNFKTSTTDFSQIQQKHSLPDNHKKEEFNIGFSEHMSIASESSICSQNDTGRKFIQTFKIQGREKSKSRAVNIMRLMCIVALFVFCSVKILQFYLKIISLEKIEGLFDLTELVFLRMDSLFQLPSQVRTVKEMTFSREPYDSYLLGFTDRPAFYSTQARSDVEVLRLINNNITNHQYYSVIHTKTEKKKIKTIELLPGSNCNNTEEFWTYSEATYSTSMSKIFNYYYEIASGLSSTQIRMDLTICPETIERKFFFAEHNIKYSVREVSEEATEIVLNETSDYVSNFKKEFIIFPCCIYFLSLVSLIGFFPLVAKVYKNLSVVMALFAEFDKDEKGKNIKSLRAFIKKIDTYFAAIKAFYYSVDFREDFLTSDIKKSVSSHQSKVENFLVLNYDPKEEEKQDFSSKEDEEGQTIQLDEIDDQLERTGDAAAENSSEIKLENAKQNIRNASKNKRRNDIIRVISSKRNIMIFHLFFILLLFSAHFVVELLLLTTFTDSTEIYRILFATSVKRKLYFNAAVFFMKENTADYTVNVDSDGNSLFSYYVNKTRRNEESFSFQTLEISQRFSALHDFYNKINGDQFCSILNSNKTENCSQDLNGIMKNGLGNFLYSFLLMLEDCEYLLEKSGDYSLEKVKKLISRETLMNITDATFFYFNDLLKAIINKYRDESISHFSSYENNEWICFGIGLFLTFGVFVMYLIIFLERLSAYLKKTKLLICILPTQFLIDNVNRVKQIYAKIS